MIGVCERVPMGALFCYDPVDIRVELCISADESMEMI